MRSLILLFTVAVSACSSNTNTKITHDVLYDIPYDDKTLVIRDVNFDNANKLCKNLKNNNTVIVASNGGISDAGLIMMKCLYEAKAKIILMEGHSAGSALSFGGAEVCLASDSVISVHRPTMKGLGRFATNYKRKLFNEYSKMQNTIMYVGGSLDIAHEYTDLVHGSEYKDPSFIFSNLVEIDREKYISLLGDKYKGTCKSSPYIQSLLKNNRKDK